MGSLKIFGIFWFGPVFFWIQYSLSHFSDSISLTNLESRQSYGFDYEYKNKVVQILKEQETTHKVIDCAIWPAVRAILEKYREH